MLFSEFSTALLKWFDLHGRFDLPWQKPRTPYRVWVSEIMLQQTQVKTAIPYFIRFTQQFPNVQTLAQAPLDSVMHAWSGLGYYSRARNLHQAAKRMVEMHQGLVPSFQSELMQLPGIGKTTAAAICAQAFSQKTAILDANVKRVLSRIFMIQGPKFENQLWEKADACMSSTRCCDYTQAIMDFGTIHCTHKKPQCQTCPMKRFCLAHQHQQVSNYPPPKSKKIKPTKEKNFYILEHEGKVFFIKNPPKGIWGGLWTLPSGPSENHHLLQSWLIQSDRPPSPTFHTSIKHTFSHFHLHLKVWKLKVEPSQMTAFGQWFDKESQAKIGMAKPISDLLTSE